MSGGFTGKYAVVDLTMATSEVFEPGEAFYKKYRDLITTQLAGSISKSGVLGLAKTFEDQLNHPVTGSTQDNGDKTPDISSAPQTEVSVHSPSPRKTHAAIDARFLQTPT